jgi:nicotinamide riboside transporter PnuC
MSFSTERAAAAAHSRTFHVLVALGFVVVNEIGWRWAGGLGFVQGWGGGIAAAIATWFLIFKSQGYWAWMIVNAALWTALFFHAGFPMLAWLQISFLVFAGFGTVQWALVRRRIGVDLRVRSDVAGSVVATALFVYSVVAYLGMPGYTGSLWWALELGSVLTAVAAMWMDAFRYKANWGAWTLSNVCSAPLFWHGGEAGPFWTLFVYQAMNVYGFVVWVRDERRVPAEVALEMAA